MTNTLTGGCQCGRIRYTITPTEHSDEPEGFSGVHICHCRICQRALGNLFGVWLPVDKAALTLTGTPKAYRSSPYLERFFCDNCGSPIGSRYVKGVEWEFSHLVGILVGTLDDPEQVRPSFQFGVESRISWADVGHGLPEKRTEDLPGLADLWKLPLPDTNQP
ncbi:hypothetical protein WH87_15350 [Devosia epidermidihirudinis]|uniref:CENP-V/GFA domain-containing protein n=1 Tax=Devosia epidermidihirudinis TaxID=1293439 RepID=A0A0F5Q7D1_9HYPH|nr:GFA family protein [Devosia epidermidihirudinis]KKC35934.1 hypothetical protein WH87_15350 [Devosia epidermidihirudinis]